MKTQTAKERMERLRRALRDQQIPAAEALTTRLADCRVKWQGTFTCRSPACVGCRRRNVRKQQRDTLPWFDHHRNQDLALISVVYGATSDVFQIGEMMRTAQEGNRKRIVACRKNSSRWDNVYMRAWHEIDAIAPDQVPLLPPQRRALIEQIVPWSISSGAPAWIGSFHGIIHTGGLAHQDIALEFGRQWKIDRQVDMRPFNEDRSVVGNISRVVSYANKFTCILHLNDGYVVDWPASWQATYFSWLQGAQRNAFEGLRFSVLPKDDSTVDQVTKPMMFEREEVEPMPCLFSTLPTLHYNTGGWA